MQEKISIEEFIPHVKETIFQLTTIGENIKDSRLLHLIFNIFLSRYKDFIQAILAQE